MIKTTSTKDFTEKENPKRNSLRAFKSLKSRLKWTSALSNPKYWAQLQRWWTQAVQVQSEKEDKAKLMRTNKNYFRDCTRNLKLSKEPWWRRNQSMIRSSKRITHSSLQGSQREKKSLKMEWGNHQNRDLKECTNSGGIRTTGSRQREKKWWRRRKRCTNLPSLHIRSKRNQVCIYKITISVRFKDPVRFECPILEWV